jgi:hypothetical protein
VLRTSAIIACLETLLKMTKTRQSSFSAILQRSDSETLIEYAKSFSNIRSRFARNRMRVYSVNKPCAEFQEQEDKKTKEKLQAKVLKGKKALKYGLIALKWIIAISLLGFVCIGWYRSRKSEITFMPIL